MGQVDTIANLGGCEVDWGSMPWQSVADVIRVRNWLSHFKQPRIGLLGGVGDEWLEDSFNKPPKIDPMKVLTKSEVKTYYDSVREAAALLAEWLGREQDFAFLRTEVFEYLEVG